MHYIKPISIVILVSISFWASAQLGDRFSEEDMEIQKSFIEAHQEKLLGRFDKALPLYEELYKSNRSNPVVSYELARLHAELDDPIESEKFINKAIALDPDNKWYHEFLAHMMTDQKRYLDAAKSFEKLVTIDVQNHGYYHDMAASYLNHGAFDQAVNSLNKLETRIGIDEEISRKKFELFDTLGEEKKAIAELDKLIKAYPNMVRYQNNLASYYAKLGQQKKANKIYQDVLKLDPDDPVATMAMSTHLAIGKEQSKLLAQLGPLVSNEDINVDKKIAKLLPYLEDESFSSDSDLEQLLTNLTEVHPTAAKSHAIKGDYHTLKGEYTQAAKSYEKTLSLDKNIYAVWSQYMSVLDANQNWNKLYSVSMDASNYFPNQAEPYYFMGKMELQNANLDDKDAFMRGMKAGDQQKLLSNAISQLTEASFIAGKNLDLKHRIYTYLAQAYSIKKDAAKAQNYVDQALEINPKGNPILEEVQSTIKKL